MSKIIIDGVKYEVVETLGFQGGHYAKVVKTLDGEKTVVKYPGGWRFWGVEDRLTEAN